jgi:DNA-directed RNA polymerase subunit RPC12/RpoP
MTMWSPNKAQWDDDDDDVYYKTVMNADGSSSVEEIPIEESKGYEVLQEDTIKCADCGKKLVDVIKVKEDDSQKKVVKVECPCGGESFIYEVVGHTYLQAFEGCAIGDMPTEFIDDVMHITIKVVK